MSAGSCLAVAAALLLFFTAPHATAQDVSPAPILQWFESSYEVQEDRLADFFMAGYGSTWIPPVSRTDSGSLSVGYDPYDRFDLGKPNNPTLYGSESGLRRFTTLMHRQGGAVTVDLVWNHNGFSDAGTPQFLEAGGYPGFFLQNPDGGQDPYGVPNTDGDFHSGFEGGDLNGRLAGLIDIKHEMDFRYIRTPVNAGDPHNIPQGWSPDLVGRIANIPDPNNARFYPDMNLDPIYVFDPNTGQGGIALYPFNKDNPLAGDAVEENALGLLMRSTRWLVEDIGIDGFRLDAARHFEPWVMGYFDRAVYRASDRKLLDGSPYHGFSYSESALTDRDVLLNQFVLKNIDPSDPGRIGGNRDALDFAQFWPIKNNLSNNGAANDWRNVVHAGLDHYDDGLINGSAGVVFVQSHDDFGPDMMNVAYAYALMRPGNTVVYYNAKQHGDNRDFPKPGRGDALGNYGDTITTLVDIRNTHGRGDYRERWLDQNEYAYERSGSALVLLSSRNDAGFDSRTLQVDLAPGTYLVELTGNAANHSEIPEVIQVFDDFGTSKVNVRFLRNDGQDKGYLIYGLATPQSDQGVQLSNVAMVLAGGSPDPGNNYDNATTRLTDLHVIQSDSFDVTLQTNAVNLLGSIRDRNADGDNALIKINDGLDLNANGYVDFVTPDTVQYGFEAFTTEKTPGYFEADGDGLYVQTIDATALPEGMNFITVRAFRHRDDGGPAVFSDFKKVVYVDRLAPEAALEALLPFSEDGHNIDFRAKSLDGTADSMHLFLNLGADLSDAQVLDLVDGNSQANKVDRDLFQRGYFDVAQGYNVLTVVTYEQTGTVNVQRLDPIRILNGNGLGAGDLNKDGVFSPDDLENTAGAFEDVLYTQNAVFNPGGDVDGDGRVDTRDLILLKQVLVNGGADAATMQAYRDVMRRRGNINGQFGTDGSDIDELYARFGSSGWTEDLNVDGTTDQADVDLLVRTLLGTDYGDADLDGAIDANDINAIASAWNGTIGWAGGDFDGNGISDFADLLMIARGWTDTSDFVALAAVAGVLTAGDLTGDNEVNQVDLNLLLSNFGQSSIGYDLSQGELTGDGRVDAADLRRLLTSWTGGEAPVFTVPEPGSALLVLVLWGVCSRRRRPVRT